MEEASRLVAELAESERPIYGINTGFGRLASVRISKDELKALQINLLRSHACGLGPPMPERAVRRLLLLRLLSLGKGFSGIRLKLLERHLDYLHRGLSPYIPIQGSVGASGDLSPLSHLGLTIIGEGHFLRSGKPVRASSVLKKEKLEPLDIAPKEGLALTNGTQFSLSLAVQALTELQKILPWSELAAAVSVEAHQATSAVFSAKLHKLKAHPEQQAVAARISKLLKKSAHMKSHRGCDRVQDAYSFRCLPQVYGPCYELIKTAQSLLEGEINSVTDNPIVFAQERKIQSCGHFHAHSVSLASDLLGTAAVSLGNHIERRVDQIVNPLTARAPAFLASRPGVESGLMIVQTAAASLASESKTMAFPGSADNIPTNGNQEDHVSMAPNAARKAQYIVTNLRRLVAAELICGVRGCVIESTRTGLSFSPSIERALAFLAEKQPSLFKAGDRVFSKDWQELDYLLENEECPQF